MSRLETLIDELQRFYGSLPSPPRDPFGLFVWEVLSVRSAPRKRDAAFRALKKIRALTPDALSRAPQKGLEAGVALAGSYAEQRLGALRSGADRFRRSPRLSQAIRGPLPDARRALRGLPQIGQDAAHRMLLFAADHCVLPVDVLLCRVARRLGYGNPTAPAGTAARSVRRALEAELGADVAAFRRTFLYLSHHGESTCTENDPHCSVCPVRGDCPQGREKLQIDD
jgi:endonuclease III